MIVGAIEAGSIVRRRGRSEWWALLALLPPAAGAAALAIDTVASDVTLSSAIGGVLLAACGVALAVSFSMSADPTATARPVASAARALPGKHQLRPQATDARYQRALRAL